jgi:hypothetical protein
VEPSIVDGFAGEPSRIVLSAEPVVHAYTSETVLDIKLTVRQRLRNGITILNDVCRTGYGLWDFHVTIMALLVEYRKTATSCTRDALAALLRGVKFAVIHLRAKIPGQQIL